MIPRHRHRYEAAAIQHVPAALFAPESTVILWRCACGAVNSTRLDGKWELHQVRGEAELRLADASGEILPQVKR